MKGCYHRIPREPCLVARPTASAEGSPLLFPVLARWFALFCTFFYTFTGVSGRKLAKINENEVRDRGRGNGFRVHVKIPKNYLFAPLRVAPNNFINKGISNL